MKFIIALIQTLFLLSTFHLKSQNSSEIYLKIQKLNVLGSLLHIGAHPDDENTSLISYFSNNHHIETTYLSLTRGDGGQNRIGTELTDALGLIRTQELLAARKIDGANQLFTTANDFGFSKHPDETLRIWDKEELLAQIVKHIRTIKPDIIINRFDHRTPGKTHGHHTASAMLSYESFELSSKSNYNPNNLNPLEIWKPKKLFFNTSWFFYGSKENFEKINKKNLIKFDTSQFNPLIGSTYNEIAAKSRSQHKSQGFGRSPEPGGPKWEYLEQIKGEKYFTNDLFEGIDITWNRLKGGDEVEKLIIKLINNFNFKSPEKNINELLNIYKKIESLKDGYWKNLKLQEVKNIIYMCLGLNFQLNSPFIIGTPESKEFFNLKIVNPSKTKVLFKKINISNIDFDINSILFNNNLFEKKLDIITDNSISSPYWLKENIKSGMYQVEDYDLKGIPESPSPIKASLLVEINGVELDFKITANNRVTDPVKGEVITPFTVIPKLTINLDKSVFVFQNEKFKKIPVSITAHDKNIVGRLTLEIPDGWSIKPKYQNVNIKTKGQEVNYSFEVSSNNKDNSGIIKPIVNSNNKTFSNQLIKIDYPHIPKQFLIKPSYAKAFGINLKNNINEIGYIMGVGDKIPESLENIGVNVINIDPSKITFENIKNLKSIVLGIRAFNVVNELKFKNKILWKYVSNGGTLIIQYNTSRGLKTNEISPYKLKISRDRVTDENSNVKILNKSHPVFNYPNTIDKTDFNGWVQERGLYFPNAWDENFEPLLEMKDPNETLKKGSLLVASYGKGKIIYTGLSFFRELPAGVPGALKLFTNLLNYGHE